MKEYYIKQKVFSLSGKFNVLDAQQNPVYKVEGSFMQIPKSFTIYNESRSEVAMITKKVFSWLPTFFVEVNGREMVTIKKEFTFFKPKYTILGTDIEVNGNWWDMEFQVLKDGQVVGKVNKEWFSWGDTYRVQVLDEDLEELIISIVVAIDCVKADSSNNSAAVTM